MPPRGRYYIWKEKFCQMGGKERRKTRCLLVLCSHKFTTLALPVSMVLYYLIIFVPLPPQSSIFLVTAFVINMTYLCLLPLFDDFLFLSVNINHSFFLCHCLVNKILLSHTIFFQFPHTLICFAHEPLILIQNSVLSFHHCHVMCSYHSLFSSIM